MTAQTLCTAVMLLAFVLGACIGGTLGWYLASPRRQRPVSPLLGSGDLIAANRRQR